MPNFSPPAPRPGRRSRSSGCRWICGWKSRRSRSIQVLKRGLEREPERAQRAEGRAAGSGFDYPAGFDALRADAHAARAAADAHAYRLQVDVTAPFGDIMGVADAIAELRSLAAEL